MINREIADEFVENLEEFSAYQISILDEFGIVISSTNPDCIGEYVKAVADNLKQVHGGYQMESQEGIIEPVLVDRHPVGYFEILGQLSEVKSIAKIVRMAMEIRLKYDMNARLEYKALTKKEELVRSLIDYQETSSKGIMSLFGAMKYNIDLPRTLMILVPDQKAFTESLGNANLYYDSYEDIIAPYQDVIVILKDTSKVASTNFALVQEYLQAYVEYIQNDTLFEGKVFISHPQADFRKYGVSYKQVDWLKNHLVLFESIEDDGVYILRDYLEYYFKGNLVDHIYGEYFDSIINQIKPFDTEEFFMIVQALIKNNYNLSQSSKDLFMHKNTLIYKVDKIKKLFHIDPVNKEADRCFLRNLLFYLRYRNLIERDRYEGN